MIAALRGKVARLGTSTVQLDVGGVFYELAVPLDVFAWLQALPAGEEVLLHVVHHFGQDDQRLFGFRAYGQRELFLAIRGLKGIGPALALSLLSHLDGNALLGICERKDTATLQKIPRVGKSTAELIVFEIGRRLERWRKIIAAPGQTPGGTTEVTEPVEGEVELALLALLQLGYKEKEARQVLAKVVGETPDIGAADLIREALRRR